MTPRTCKWTPWLVMLISVYALILVRTAWLGDDAFISLRVVDNFVSGLGLRWNAAERVQAHTSPLWVFVLSVAYFFTREAYFTTLLVCMAVSISGVALITFRAIPKREGGLVALCILLSSRSFIDYSTSGLENPLTHVLLALFVIQFLKAERDESKHLRNLMLIAAVAMLNRMDTILFFLPALTVAAWRRPVRTAVKALALGSLPILVWMLFSTIYYGFPFPNTAYAKLGGELALSERIGQGLTYLLDSLDGDPITLAVILWALCLSALSRCRNSIALSCGILLYMLYNVRVGGDHMSGRLLSAPLAVSAILVARNLTFRGRYSLAVPVAIVLLVGLAGRAPNLMSGTEDSKFTESVIPRSGILDTRRYYNGRGTLLNFTRFGELPFVGTRREQSRRMRIDSEAKVVTTEAIGYFGYYSSRNTHIVDLMALADPLLARLPARYDPTWRVGHLARRIPAGYLETLETGENLLEDEGIAEFYSKLQLITRGDLFSAKRLGAIFAMNFGQYDHLIDREAFRFGDLAETTLEELNAAGERKEYVAFDPIGLRVSLGATRHDDSLRITMESQDRLRFLFVSNGEVVGQSNFFFYARSKPISSGLLHVPHEVAETGYDELRIYGLLFGRPPTLASIEFAE